MLFVSGLIGLDMAPIPANESAAMLFSFFVAYGNRALADAAAAPGAGTIELGHEAAHGEGSLRRLYRRFPSPSSCARAESSWLILIVLRVGDSGGSPVVRDEYSCRPASAIRQ